jgi:fatty acid desaturase
MADAARDNLEAQRRAVVLLRQFATPSDLQGFLGIARGWTVIGATWCVNALLIGAPLSIRVLAFLVSALVVGIALGGLESCAHEATHYTLFATRRLNNRLQFLFAAPVLESVEDYRASHVVHHRALGGADDPAMQLYAETGVARFPHGFFWVMFVRPLLGYHALHFLRRTVAMIAAQPKRGVHIAVFWIPVLAAMYHFEIGWWLAAYFLFPLFYVLPIILFWAEVLDHSRLDLMAPARAARTHVGRLALAFYPHNEGYHLVHHLHPGIPAHRLAEAHRELTRVAWFAARAVPSHRIGETVRDLHAAEAAITAWQARPR